MTVRGRVDGEALPEQRDGSSEQVPGSVERFWMQICG